MKHRRPRRFPGIATDAARLGVCRTHLYRVLTGRRRSRRLIEQYYALKADGKAA